MLRSMSNTSLHADALLPAAVLMELGLHTAESSKQQQAPASSRSCGDPHGHLHAGDTGVHLHAEPHPHVDHTHPYHSHVRTHGAAALAHSQAHSGTATVCSLPPNTTASAPVDVLDDVHCDGECCDLLDWVTSTTAGGLLTK